MAKSPQRILKSKIINIEADPLHKGRTIVSVQFDDGDDVRGPWIQAFSIVPTGDRPITPEEFQIMLRTKEIERPIDPFHYLKEYQGKEFDLTLDNPIP